MPDHSLLREDLILTPDERYVIETMRKIHYGQFHIDKKDNKLTRIVFEKSIIIPQVIPKTPAPHAVD